MLAMVVNDNAGILMPLGVVEFIASKLAPTGMVRWHFGPERCWGRRLGFPLKNPILNECFWPLFAFHDRSRLLLDAKSRPNLY